MPLAGKEILSFILTVGGWTSRWEEVDGLDGGCFVKLRNFAYGNCAS